MQYVACSFTKGGRTYTYHNDGEPVKVGDEVKVEGGGPDGWKRVYVEGVSSSKPSFNTKPILGIAPPKED